MLLPLLLLSVFPVTVMAEDASVGTWETKQPMPKPEGGAAVVVDNKIYMFFSDGSRVSSLYIYDPSVQSWAEKAGMPTFRDGYGLAAVGNKIYTIGGQHTYYKDGSSVVYGYPSDVNEVYDVQTGTWTSKQSLPLAVVDVAANVVGGKIYIIGGGDSKTLVYDPATDSWSERTPPPRYMARYLSAVIGNKIYIISDVNEYSVSGSHVGELFIYDTAADSWSTGTSIPKKYSSSGITVANGPQLSPLIYVMGGCTILSLGEFEPTDACYAYNPASNSWSAVTTLPTARMGFAIATFNNKIYTIGGGVEGGFPTGVITDVVEVYNPTGLDNAAASESPSSSDSPTPSQSPTEKPTEPPTQTSSPPSQTPKDQDNSTTLILGALFASIILILLIATTFYLRGNRKPPKYFYDNNYYVGPDETYLAESGMQPDIQYPDYPPPPPNYYPPLDTENLCPYCKLPTNGETICPHCYRRIR
jgi:N-acetylneuraminic acid mutarotase